MTVVVSSYGSQGLALKNGVPPPLLRQRMLGSRRRCRIRAVLGQWCDNSHTKDHQKSDERKKLTVAECLHTLSLTWPQGAFQRIPQGPGSGVHRPLCRRNARLSAKDLKKDSESKCMPSDEVHILGQTGCRFNAERLSPVGVDGLEFVITNGGIGVVQMDEHTALGLKP